MYSKELEFYIRVGIDYIIKIEFFIAFYIVYNSIIILINALRGFRGISLMLFDLQVVILKFDIKLRTSIPIGPLLPETDS